jgi:hypothetical protein
MMILPFSVLEQEHIHELIDHLFSASFSCSYFTFIRDANSKEEVMIDVESLSSLLSFENRNM